MNTDLIEKHKISVKSYMESADPDNKLTYHNWRHISYVMDSLEILMAESKVTELQKENLMLAALYHDVEYSKGMMGHELRSADFASKRLKEEGFDKDRLQDIHRLIIATEMNYKASELDELLIKDADLAHMASDIYMEFYNGLYKEIKNLGNMSFTRKEWKKDCIKFMASNEYLSLIASEKYKEGKINNLLGLMNMDESEDDSEKSQDSLSLTKQQKKAIKKQRKKGEPKFNTEKGIETMFRVSLRNHINLSRIADDKANTLISVNAIILSIVLSALFPKLDSNPFLIYPGFSLILVSIITIILATLSTIPKTTHGKVSKQDVMQKKGNLLFFGNFHQMSLNDFEWGVRELMKDGSYLYGTLTRDLYFLGLVLNKKYNLLRWGYFVFVIGLIMSIILFVWSIVTLAPEPIIPTN